MDQQAARQLIEAGIRPNTGNWLDIGAGTGVFTEVLFEVLSDGKVFALDKSPHALWRLQAPAHLDFEIIDQDFNRPFALPMMDGMVMANALHYAPAPEAVLRQLLAFLKPGSPFILVEYDLTQPNTPWIPYPVARQKFEALAPGVGLSFPQLIGRKPSVYGPQDLYAVYSLKQNEC